MLKKTPMVACHGRVQIDQIDPLTESGVAIGTATVLTWELHFRPTLKMFFS